MPVYYRSLELCAADHLGPLHVYANDSELLGIYFATNHRRVRLLSSDVKVLSKGAPLIEALAVQMDEYLRGIRTSFTLPLHLQGTEFQLRVWRSLLKIPYGSTISYSEEARAINRPESVRAVARANGQNHFAIVIPCHRVIAADGGLGGYSGGLAAKRWLLRMERGSG